ncbi:RNA polymerase sigma-54 factor, partial [Thioclava sp. BHET1]
STLLRIGRQIVRDQQRFFTEGPEFILPMNRRRMAEELSLHPSTVGRAVAGKAIAAGGALYPLSLFFSTAIPITNGETLSSHAIRLHIRRLIEAEPADMPLSDQRICALLRDVGVDISRRTVAKYRGCMRIPSSSERRRRRA